MAKSLLAVRGKKKATRKTKSENYLVNWKYLGDEPVSSNIKTNVDLIKALTWYNTMSEADDARQYLKDYFSTDKTMLKIISGIPDKRLPLTSAWLCRIASNANRSLTDSEWVRVNTDIQEASKFFEAQDEEKPVEQKVKPSIQDRVKERVADIIGDVEALVDKCEAINMYEWLQKNEIPAMHAVKIAEYYKPLRDEYTYAITEDNEGYKHYTKSQLKTRLGFIHTLIEDCERFSGNVKKARAPRKKKAPTTEKLLKHFTYLKAYNEYKLQSIDPATIIGAQELWTFDTKYNRLTVFRARGPAGLTVKRTSISGYDTVSSLTKKIGRKTEEYIKKVLTGGKITLRKLMDEINTEPSSFSDRINNFTILLRSAR
jgi:hypothetical protein